MGSNLQYGVSKTTAFTNFVYCCVHLGIGISITILADQFIRHDLAKIWLLFAMLQIAIGWLPLTLTVWNSIRPKLQP